VRSSVALDVAAPAGLVFELARDVERWPLLLPHYRDVRVLERHHDGSLTARMLALRPVAPALGYGIPVAWRARVWTEPAERRLRFRHVGGATGGMDVAWRIASTDGGCHVSIEHVFRPPLPGWAELLDVLFVRPIATRTLASFKAIAEAADAATRAPGSAGPPTAKESS
jgi:uncharacterized membrane protein